MRTHRIGTILLAVVWLLASVSASALPGDVYVDCKVDVADVVLLERALAGGVTLTDEQRAGADLVPIGGSETDEVVDVGDLVTLKRIVARDADPAVPGLSTPPMLDALAPTTTNNPIVVSGTAPAGASIRLFVNGREHPQTVTATGGQFSFGGSNALARIPLVDGTNRITAVATSGSARSCSSAAQTTVYTPGTSFKPKPSDPEIGGSADPGEGEIDSTEVWTPALTNGQAIVAHEDIIVKTGAALFILPGTRIRFDANTRLEVENGGTLQILGTPDNRPLLDASSATSGTCTGRWAGIVVDSSAQPVSTIENAKIDCVTFGLTVSNGGAGSALVGNVILKGTEISRWQNWGVFIFAKAAGAWIENNRIQIGPAAGSRGIFSDSQGSSNDVTSRNSIRIVDNIVAGRSAGLEIGGRPDEVRGNTVTGDGTTANSTGVRVYDSHWFTPQWPATPSITISENTITNFCNGVVNQLQNANADFDHNNVFDNSCWNYTTSGSCPGVGVSLPAHENWWGSTVLVDVQGTLDGCSGDPGQVDFSPYLDAPFDLGGDPVTGSGVIQGEIHDANKPASGGDWQVIGTVTVPATKTFTIPDGQVLRFAENAQLVVEGELVVDDQNSSDVLFTALSSGAPAENHWKGIVVQGGGDASIADAVVEYATTAIKVSGGALELSGSLIRNFASVGIRIEGASSASIYDNRNVGGTLGVHASAGKDGVVVQDVTGSVSIENNEIKNASAAVRVVNSSPELHANLIKTSTFGVHIAGAGAADISSDDAVNPATRANEITGNCWGIYVNAPSTQPVPLVTKNKIHSNSGCPGNGSGNYNFYVAAYGSSASPVVLDAQSNWWGSTDLATIAGKIRDRSDTSGLPIVDYAPYYASSAMSAIAGETYLLGAVSSNPSEELTGAHTVVGPVFVPANQIWRLGAGAILEFAGADQLTVDGSLVLGGTSGSGVTLRHSGAGKWYGIVASGAPASGEPKLDVRFATIEDALYAISATNASGTVSIEDSEILGANIGVALNGVTNATIERTSIDGSSNPNGGTGISVIDSDVVIDDANEIRNVWAGILVAGDSDATIGSASSGNLIEDFSTTGILFFDVGQQGRVEGNTIANTFSDQAGQGIELIDSSPEIIGNTISGTYFGIHVFADSNPEIRDGNVISDNVWGILLRGKRYPNPPANPAGHRNPNPTIERNDLVNVCADPPPNGCVGASPLGQSDLCPVTGGNICVSGYQYDADLVIDARENYWGSTNENVIRTQKVFMEGGNPIPLDFSRYLNGPGGQPVFPLSVVFSSIFQSVTVENPIIRPTRGPAYPTSTTISFTLTAPTSDVNVRIYREADATLIRTFGMGPLGVGPHSTLPWDGRDSADQLLPDDAYRFEIEAAQIDGPTHLYKLERDGRIVGGAAAVSSGGWNAHRNQYKKVVVQNPYSTPMRAIMRVDDGPGMSAPGPTLLTRVLATAQKRLFVFDGRDDQGTILTSPSSDPSDYYLIGFHGLSKVVRNAIFVQDTAPSIYGASYVIAEPPTISDVEVLSDPYLAVPTYDQIATIRFKLDQPGNVTVKMLKPGAKDASNPADVVAVLDVIGAGLDKSAVWLGYDNSAPSANEIVQAVTSGSYTFFIEAQHPTQSNLKSTYRGTIQVRLAPGM